jgi:Protein of unknown function (DUF2283)
MNEPRYNYDEESDTLSITFPPSEKATGIELTDHIIVHLNKAARRIVRLTLLDYSILVQQTEFGPRTFPMTGLTDSTEEMRELLFDILRQQPVSEVLRIAAYTPKDGQVIPTVLVQPVGATTETP